MKNLSLVFVLAILISGLSACNGGSFGSSNLGKTAATAVPDDATMVVSINLKSLMDKADMDAVKKMDFYQDILAKAAEQGEAMAKIVENPEESGIDLSKNAYMFMKMDGNKSNPSGLGGMVFSIADAEQFKILVKESDMKAKKGSGFQYAVNNDAVVAWNGSLGFVGAMADRYSEEEDVVSTLNEIFSGKNSIATNDKAAKALGGNHDVNFYMSTSSIIDMFGDELAASEFFISKEDLRNNSFSGYTDFKKGEIVSVGNSSLSKGLKSDLKMILGEGSNTNFSKYIPADGLVMLMTGKLNFKGINQLLKDKNVNGIANMQLNSVGLTTDDIAKAIDGDMAVAMNMKKGRREPSPVLTIKIGDRDKLDDILNKGEALGVFEKDGANSYVIGGMRMMGIPKGKLLIKDNVLIFSSDMDYIAKMEKGGLSRSEQISKAKYKGATGVLGMYMSYSSLADGMSGMSPMDLPTNGIEEMQYSFDWDESSSKVTMEDKSKNALQAMIEGMNDAYLKGEANRDQYDEEMEDLLEGLEVESEKIDM